MQAQFSVPTGAGADVMKRIAAPMIGGMVSSTMLTLLVIPVLYAIQRPHLTLTVSCATVLRD